MAIRNEVNRWLCDGRGAREIADWLNTRKEVCEILNQKWPGQPIQVTNVRSWRRTGYQQWLRQREQLENLKELAGFALDLGRAAGGNVVDGSAAIVGGKIMAELENAAGDDLHKMVRSIAQLRSGDIHKARLAQVDQKLALERQKYQRQTAELFLKWYADKKARDIVESRDSNAGKIELLGRAMFGEDW
jgi:hypothetical protein